MPSAWVTGPRPGYSSSMLERITDPRVLAMAQGATNIAGGAWPILSIRSFEKVFGAKVDRWLVYTVGGLLIANGTAQMLAARAGELRSARWIGIGTATPLAAIDAIYAPTGRIRWTYLLDGVIELSWIGLWLGAREPDVSGA